MRKCSLFFTALLLNVLSLPGSSQYAAAQGQPVSLGSQIPVAVWAVATCILGLAIAYGIVHNRNRTRAERRTTDAATKANYIAEERKERSRN